MREDDVQQGAALQGHQDLSDEGYHRRLAALNRKRDHQLQRIERIYPSTREREAEARATARRAMIEASATIWQATIEALEADHPAETRSLRPSLA